MFNIEVGQMCVIGCGLRFGKNLENSWLVKTMNLAKTFFLYLKNKLFFHRLLARLGLVNNFHGVYGNWADALSDCADEEGYGNRNLLQDIFQANRAVLNGTACYERDGVLFDQLNFDYQVIAAFCSAIACIQRDAAENKGLNVLDFGGGFGTLYRQITQFNPNLRDSVNWKIVEQSTVVALGIQLVSEFKVPLSFYSDIQSCVGKDVPHVIVMSAVIEFLESPRSIMAQLAKVNAHYLIIDRIPILLSGQSHITVCDAARSVGGSYPVHLFNWDDFQGLLDDDWTIINTFKSLGGVGYASSGAFEYYGFLCQRKDK